MKRIALLLVLILCLLIVGIVLAGSSENYRIDWFTPMTSNGGGTASSANYDASFTVGQSVIGASSSGNYEVCLGFWCEAIRALGISLSVTLDGTGSGSVTSDPAGIDCPGDCSETLDYGTVITLTAEADTSSTFSGWTGAGCSGTGNCVITMDTAKSVTATFNVVPLPEFYLPTLIDHQILWENLLQVFLRLFLQEAP